MGLGFIGFRGFRVYRVYTGLLERNSRWISLHSEAHAGNVDTAKVGTRQPLRGFRRRAVAVRRC